MLYDRDRLYISYTYDAWGKVLSVRDGEGNAITGINNIANRNPLRYRGYVYDPETKLYYCQSRYYDPQTRRFINADGGFDEGAGFLGYNLFTYCSNNPVMLYDPTGKTSLRTCFRFFIRTVISSNCLPLELYNIFQTTAEFSLDSAAPIALEIMDCPVTKAFLAYAMSGKGGEVHNQHLLEGYEPMTELLVEALKNSEEWRSMVIQAINKGNYPTGDLDGEFNNDYDLYIAVHGFDYWLNITPKGNNTYGIHVVLWDKFDFDDWWIKNKKQLTKANLANDIGYYTQLTGGLTPFKFWINFGYDIVV